MKTALRMFTILLAMLTTSSAIAQQYPSRPLRIITGYTPGGGASTATRIFAEALGANLNQRVIVDNRPGAGQAIGAKAAINASADGYNIFVGGLGPHPSLHKNGVDVTKELEAISMMGVIPLAFIVNSGLKIKSVAELATYARANPGKLNFASSGGDAYLNLMMALLADRAGGFSYTHVPYRGAPEIQIGLLAGDVHIALAAAVTAMANIKSGKVNAILIGGAERSPVLPDVPTPEEAGLKAFSVETVMGLWAPLGTPREIILKLSSAANAVAKDPGYIQKLTGIGISPIGTTPEETLRRFRSQLQLIEEASRLAKFKPE